MTDSSKRWLCTVCGYVHDGDEPCDCCPICGATSELFEIYEQPASPAAPKQPERWRCLTCEYVAEGDAPPAFCPVCGVSDEHFEALETQPQTLTAGDEDLDVVIVGAGIAGFSAAEAVRNASSKARITLLSRESDLPYYRLNLTRYLAGEINSDELAIRPAGWYEDNNINLLLNADLQKIDAADKSLILADAQQLSYDKLVLTMGSHPFIPPFPGSARENVTALRTRRDADFILEQVRAGMPCTVIGGGLLGIEAAAALTRHKADVTLIEGHPWLMPQQLNQAAGDVLAREVEGLGIKLCLGARIKHLEGDEKVRGVSLESGRTIAAELVIVTAGVRSNSYLARMAELETNNGIVVNNELKTSAPDIYAAGDVSEHRGVLYGTWGPSQFQGAIAGMNVVGGNNEFAGIPRSNSIKVLGSDMFSIGKIRVEDGSYAEVEVTAGDNYAYFLFRDSCMVGSILLGDTSLSAPVKKLIEKKVQCSELFKKEIAAADFCSRLEGFAATVA